MVLTFIFIILTILVLLGTAVYLTLQKNKLKSTRKEISNDVGNRKRNKRSNKNISDILDIQIIDNIICLGNRYSSILELGSIDFNMLSDDEQTSIENVLMQTALSIDYPVQFFSTMEYIDTTKVIGQIKENKVNSNALQEYRGYLINYLENLMESRNISVLKNYAIISYDGAYENAQNELVRRCNSFKLNLLRAKISSSLLTENDLYNLIYRELNKNSKIKVDLLKEGGQNLYVKKRKLKKEKQK